MEGFWGNYESVIRMSFFVLGFLLFTSLGFLFPFRKDFNQKTFRMRNHFILTVLNSILISVFIPLTGVMIAIESQTHSLGLLHWFQTPYWIKAIIGFLFLEMLVYWFHRISHTNSFLWKFHRLHHSDTHFDSSTALRFHPIEILISMMAKLGGIFVMGVSPEVVVVFEIVLNFSAMFNHGNYQVPLDVILRKFIVTPDFHRVHHSPVQKETDSNFGFFLSIWDYVFFSYRKESEQDPKTRDYGLEYFRENSENEMIELITQPFRHPKDSTHSST